MEEETDEEKIKAKERKGDVKLKKNKAVIRKVEKRVQQKYRKKQSKKTGSKSMRINKNPQPIERY